MPLSRDKMRAYMKAYRRAKGGQKSYAKRWAAKNPEKVKAHAKAREAVGKASGKCARCGRRGATQKHHPDYSRPTKVEQLCARCHARTKRKAAAPKGGG